MKSRLLDIGVKLDGGSADGGAGSKEEKLPERYTWL